MKKIKFIKSPMGLGLGYSEGEEGIFETIQADELIELGLAIEIETPIEKAEKVVKAEKAVKK
jgi:hypothetical protein